MSSFASAWASSELATGPAAKAACPWAEPADPRRWAGWTRKAAAFADPFAENSPRVADECGSLVFLLSFPGCSSRRSAFPWGPPLPAVPVS